MQIMWHHDKVTTDLSAAELVLGGAIGAAITRSYYWGLPLHLMTHKVNTDLSSAEPVLGGVGGRMQDSWGKRKNAGTVIADK